MITNSYIRSYNHNVIDLTKSKFDVIHNLLFEYRRVAKIILNKQLSCFFKNGNISVLSKEFYGGIETFLSERYKDVIKRQIDGMLKSYISNCKNKFINIVRQSSLNKEQKKELFKTNKQNLWFNGEDNFLARKIFKKVLSNNNFPTVNHINMVLNTKVYTLEQNDNTKTCSYHVLLKTSNGRGETIDLGLLHNSRFNQILKENVNNPTINNSIQLNFDKQNNLKTIALLLTFTKTINNNEINKSIGMDFGVKNLFTTSSGNIYGKNFINKLVYYDNKRLKLEKELKRRDKNYKLSINKRYSNIVYKTKSFIKNETNRVINKIIKTEKVNEIVIEELNFQGTNLSKRMNRLISNCGLGNINNKLKSISEELGIKITKVNSAFTSQECNNCGYTHKKNRPTRDEFECICCGKKEKSDIKSSKTILGRSKNGWFNSKDNKYANLAKIKQELSLRFLETKRGKFFSESVLSCAQVDKSRDLCSKG